MTTVLERFDVGDIPEIVRFLNRVWGAAYGPAVRPVFTEEYLHWLYGGPEAQRTAIVGSRKDDRIVSVKAMLARELAVRGGPPRAAYLGTHMAIDPTMPLAERLTLLPIADQLWLNATVCGLAELAYTVFDAVKPLARRTEVLLARQGISRVIGTFAQMVATPALVERSPTSLASRPGSVDDAEGIVALAAQVARSASLAVRLTPARVRHHWFNAPSGEVFVTESGSVLSGACCVYRLRTTRGFEETAVAVLESFLAMTPEAHRLVAPDPAVCRANWRQRRRARKWNLARHPEGVRSDADRAPDAACSDEPRYAASMHELTDKMAMFPSELHEYVRRYQWPLEAFAAAWADVCRRLNALARDHADRCLEVRYEDLVADPAGQLSRICTFLDEPADVMELLATARAGRETPGLGDWKTYQTAAITSRSVGRWRSLAPDVIARLAPVVNPVLEMTGYEPVPAPRQLPRAAARRVLQLSLLAAKLKQPTPESSGER
jgi:Sulfotransferase family